MKKLLLVGLVAVAVCGCGVGADNLALTNGTTVLLFPEWEQSTSAFERKVYTNYFAVYRDGYWYTREREGDGSLSVFWKNDLPHRKIVDAKSDFGLNIQWNVYKGIYDAMSK